MNCNLLRFLYSSILIFLFFSCGSKKSDNQFPFQNPDLSVEDRAENLVSLMTLEEKVGQMMYSAQEIQRLGIPKYNWWNECLHGVARASLATVFPEPIGLAAMFDDSTIFKMADIISTEARAKHHEFVRKGEHDIYQGLTFWTPNINIFRDPRWGRGMETYGEDPYLTARNGVALVKGFQGNDPKFFKIIATAKHYVVHSGPESERHSFDAVVDERDFLETYTPAFEALIKEGKAYSVMCAYNRYKGEACCGSNTLLNQILRKEWGFNGYIVSDCWAINDIWGGHKIKPTKEESVALAVKSGTDLECGESYEKLLEAVKKGLITEAEINVSVKRLMTARFKLGLFDLAEKVPYANIPYSMVDCNSHKQAALDVTRKSIVLLKNEDNLLPLKKDLKNILVCGPNAENAEMLLGNYNGMPSKAITPLEGIKEKLGSTARVVYEKGCDWVNTMVTEPIPDNFLNGNGKPGFYAEYYTNMKLEGTPALTQNENKISFRFEGGEIAPGIKNTNCSVRWTADLTAPETGEYTFTIRGNDGYRVFIDDKAIFDQWKENPTINYFTKTKLEKDKKYKIKVEFYQEKWGSEISFEWKMPNKDSKQMALELAKKSDVVIMFAGITSSLEGEEMPVKIEGFQGGDRTLLSLPKVQVEFLKALKATDKPIVLVLLNGSALAVNWENDNIPAIVEAWYPGQAAGTAIADVLFGDYNPAGRLPVTFYKSEKDLPSFGDYNMKGRTYKYFSGDVLYPFGYGLSYTTFKYSNLQLPESIEPGQNATIKVDVQNTGSVDGDEIVQLYVADKEASVPVAIRSLQGFKRVSLKKGEMKTVEFTLIPRQMSLIDKDFKRIVEPGKFEISVGGGQPIEKFAKTSNFVSKIIEVKGNVFEVK